MNMNKSQQTWYDAFEKRQAKKRESLAKAQQLHDLRAQMDQSENLAFKEAFDTRRTTKEN
jgi:hypothetical protein